MAQEGSPEAGDRAVVADMARALFVATNGVVAFLLLAFTVAAISQAIGPPPEAPDTVVPRLGIDDAAILAFAALVACAGVVLSVRYWLRGSWHVATVTFGTLAALVALGGALLLTLRLSL